MNRPKLLFFEKDNLDEFNRMPVTVGTNDLPIDNLKTPYKSSAKSKGFSEVEVGIEYLSFFNDGIESKGNFKINEITSGEPAFQRESEGFAMQKAINLEFNETIDKSVTLGDIPKECLPETSPATSDPLVNPITSYNLPEASFIPEFKVGIGLGEFSFFSGADDYSSTLRKLSIIPNQRVNKWEALNTIFNSAGVDYYNNSLVFSFDEINNLDSLAELLTKNRVIRSVSNQEIEITQSYNFSFLRLPREITETVNASYDIMQKTSVKDVGLIKNLGNLSLGSPAEQTLTVSNINAGILDGSSDDDIDEIVNQFSFSFNSFVRGHESFFDVDPRFSSGDLVDSYRADYQFQVPFTNFPADFISFVGDSETDQYSDIITIILGNIERELDSHRQDYTTLSAQQFNRNLVNVSFYSELASDTAGSVSGFSSFLSTTETITREALARVTSKTTTDIRNHIRQTVKSSVSSGSSLGGLSIDNLLTSRINLSNADFANEPIAPIELGLQAGELSVNDTGTGFNLTEDAKAFTSQVVFPQDDIGGSPQLRRLGFYRFVNVPSSNLNRFPLRSENTSDLASINRELENSPVVLNAFFQGGRQITMELKDIIEFGSNSSAFSSANVSIDGESVALNSNYITRLRLIRPNGTVSNFTCEVIPQGFRGSSTSSSGFNSQLVNNFYRRGVGNKTLDDLINSTESNQEDFTNSFLIPASSFQIQATNLLITNVNAGVDNTEPSDLNLDNCNDQANRQRIIDLLQSDNPEFPFVQVNQLKYNISARRLELYMSRKSDNAPVPSPHFFDSIELQETAFNFSDASYKTFEKDDEASPVPNVNLARYYWNNVLNNPVTEDEFPIKFIKSGVSNSEKEARSITVQKSTVKTSSTKVFPDILNGFRISSFDFDIDNFTLIFKGQVLSGSFSCVRIYDKTGTIQLSRDLTPSLAIITENDNGTTSYAWENFAEFKTLQRVKDYQIGILKNASETEDRFFIPNPAETGFHFLTSLLKDDNDLKFSLEANGSEGLGSKPFINFKIKNIDGSDFLSSKSLRAFLDEGNNFILPEGFNGLDLPDVNTKMNAVFTVENFPPLNIDIIKMTDLYFDTVVILNTNLDDIGLYNALGNSLIHPSDIERFFSVIEDGERHIVLFLKNPVATGALTIKNYKIAGSGSIREIGEVKLLKRIGTFSKYPFVRVSNTKNRQASQSQFNKAHIKTQPESINYDLEFPPLDNAEDLKLAQDLFSRSEDYNEFLIWAVGGNIPSKINSLKGFRFKDIIKSLAVNEFDFQYADGRFSSGVNFTLKTMEVL